MWNQGAKNVEGPCSKKTQAWPDCCGPCDTYPAQPCPPFTGHWPADSSRRSLAATSWPRRCLISSRVTWVEGGSSGRKSDHSFLSINASLPWDVSTATPAPGRSRIPMFRSLIFHPAILGRRYRSSHVLVYPKYRYQALH